MRWDVPEQSYSRKSLEMLLKLDAEVDSDAWSEPSGAGHISETIQRHITMLNQIIADQGATPRVLAKACTHLAVA